MFKRRRFPVEIILVCVRWYSKYGITYRDLSEMMHERGVDVDTSTIFRWGHCYAPELEKCVRRYQGYLRSPPLSRKTGGEILSDGPVELNGFLVERQGGANPGF